MFLLSVCVFLCFCHIFRVELIHFCCVVKLSVLILLSGLIKSKLIVDFDDIKGKIISVCQKYYCLACFCIVSIFVITLSMSVRDSIEKSAKKDEEAELLDRSLLNSIEKQLECQNEYLEQIKDDMEFMRKSKNDTLLDNIENMMIKIYGINSAIKNAIINDSVNSENN